MQDTDITGNKKAHRIHNPVIKRLYSIKEAGLHLGDLSGVSDHHMGWEDSLHSGWKEVLPGCERHGCIYREPEKDIHIGPCTEIE